MTHYRGYYPWEETEADRQADWERDRARTRDYRRAREGEDFERLKVQYNELKAKMYAAGRELMHTYGFDAANGKDVSWWCDGGRR